MTAEPIRSRNAAAPDPRAALTPREQRILALVAQGYQAKEIAPRVGISVLRVRKDLASARAKMGVSRSLDAARLLGAPREPGVNDAPGQPLTLPHAAPAEAYGLPERPAASLAREERSPYRLEAPSPAGLHLLPPLRQPGGEFNELSRAQRWIWMVLLMAMLFAAFGTMAIGLGLLSNR